MIPRELLAAVALHPVIMAIISGSGRGRLRPLRRLLAGISRTLRLRALQDLMKFFQEGAFVAQHFLGQLDLNRALAGAGGQQFLGVADVIPLAGCDVLQRRQRAMDHLHLVLHALHRVRHRAGMHGRDRATEVFAQSPQSIGHLLVQPAVLSGLDKGWNGGTPLRRQRLTQRLQRLAHRREIHDHGGRRGCRWIGSLSQRRFDRPQAPLDGGEVQMERRGLTRQTGPEGLTNGIQSGLKGRQLAHHAADRIVLPGAARDLVALEGLFDLRPPCRFVRGDDAEQLLEFEQVRLRTGGERLGLPL